MRRTHETVETTALPTYAQLLTRARRRTADLRDGEGAPGAGAPPAGNPPPAWRGPASQEELDQIIETRLSRERAAFRRELDAARGQGDPKEREELEALRRDKADRERKAQEDRGQYERALDSVRNEHKSELDKLRQETEAILGELRQTRCTDALLSVASDMGAINARQVARLLEANVKLDDNRRVIVLDDEGNPWLKAGKNIGIADLMEKFAHDNPHLFKPKPGEGAGAKGGSETADLGGEGIDAQIAEAEEAYKKAHEAAEKSGALSDVAKARTARKTLEALKTQKAQKKT